MYDIISMKTIAHELNNRTYTDYYYRLMLLARSVFKWNNLPNGIEEKWIERFLFNEGQCMFFKDKEKGYMVAKCTLSGDLNYYEEPTTLYPVINDYVGDDFINGKNAVLISNNDDRIPTSPTIQLYALRLAEIQRTIDININAQKTPTLILCSEKQRLTLMQVYKKWSGNEPLIFGDKNLDLSDIKTLKTDAPIVFDKLQLQKHAVWNECMTFLGINNANMDKRERLVDDEVQANNEQIDLGANIFLKAREDAAENIKEVFDLKDAPTVERRLLDLAKLKSYFGISDNLLEQAAAEKEVHNNVQN